MLAAGHKLEKHFEATTKGGKHVEFIFVEDERGTIRDAVATYYRGASCGALDFYRHLTELKHILRESRIADEEKSEGVNRV